MKGNIAGLLQQAQKMQQDMQKAQEELAKKEHVGEAGAGLVRVTINGKHEVKQVELDASLFNTTIIIINEKTTKQTAMA